MPFCRVTFRLKSKESSLSHICHKEMSRWFPDNPILRNGREAKESPSQEPKTVPVRAVWATQNMQWRSLDDLHGGLKPSHWVNPLSQDQKMTPKHNFKTMLWLFWIYGLFMENKLGHVVIKDIVVGVGYLLSKQYNRIGDLIPHPSPREGGVAGCFGTSTVGGTGGATTVSTGAGEADLLWKFLEKPSGLTLCGRLICCWFHRPWNAWRGQPDDFFPVCSNLQCVFSMFQFGFRSKTILNLVKMGLWIVLYKYRKSPQPQLSRLLPQLVQLGLGTLALCRVPGVALPAPGSWVESL